MGGMLWCTPHAGKTSSPSPPRHIKTRRGRGRQCEARNGRARRSPLPTVGMVRYGFPQALARGSPTPIWAIVSGPKARTVTQCGTVLS